MTAILFFVHGCRHVETRQVKMLTSVTEPLPLTSLL